ncbi:MAG: amidohydrolase family protein [Candidatus Dormiibacterota bacterium]
MTARRFQDLTVVDFHVHFRGEGARLAAEPSTAAEAAAGAAPGMHDQDQWRLAWDFPEPDGGGGRSWEEEADAWAAELDRCGVERIVFVTGGGNDRLAEVVRRHPDRFLGFAHHDPFLPGAAEELERAIGTLGLRGLKLIAPRLSRRIDDPAGRPVWEVVAAHRIPVLIHFGMSGAAGGIAYNDKIDPAHLEPVAKEFPTVNFVVPHFGIQYVKELLFLCWACPNVHVDTSGSNQWVRWMPYPLTLDDLFRKFLETVGPERIVYGSDSSWFPRGYVLRYLQDQIRVCRFLRVRHDDLQAIFGGNAARLLGLPLDGNRH